MNLSFDRRRQHGSLSVEAALLLPVLILILALGSLLADHQLAQQRLHRAVAATADVLANQPLPAQRSLGEQLALDGEASFQLLAAMLADPRNGELPQAMGLHIRHLDSERRTPEGVPFERRWALGMLECEHEMPLAPDLRRLTTPQNVGRAEFVQVEACFDNTLPFPLPQWAVPTRIESRFVAARRHWRGG